MVTIWDCTGPLVVPYDQLQGPYAFGAAVPTDAVHPTGAAPGSAQVPVAGAVWLSFTANAVMSAVTVGGRLAALSWNVEVAVAPFGSVAVMVTVCDCTGPSVVAYIQ